MDKRKEKAIGKVKETEYFGRQERDNLIGTLLEVDLQIEAIKAQQNHIDDLKIQQTSGEIRQRDKFGYIIDQKDLHKFIQVYEHDLRRMKWNLLKMMDNLFYILNGKNSQELKLQIEAHYQLVKENYEKAKEMIKNVV